MWLMNDICPSLFEWKVSKCNNSQAKPKYILNYELKLA
jgi:hypothetical protein